MLSNDYTLDRQKACEVPKTSQVSFRYTSSVIGSSIITGSRSM